MGFEKLIDKVAQAEHALEARERSVGADWRQLKTSWRAAWTPGRIIVAGLASGFLVGRARPLARASGGGVLQAVTALSGLFAGGSAQVAAKEADDAVEHAEATSEAAAAGVVRPSAPTQPPVERIRMNVPRGGGERVPADPVQEHERMRRSGLV